MKKLISANRKKIIIISLLLGLMLIIGSIITVVLVCNIPSEKTILTVGKTDVSYGEFSLLADGLKTDIVTYFYSTHNVNEGIDFWDKDSDFGGETPLEVLKEKTIEAAKEIKIEQQLMVEYGVIEKSDMQFSTFQKLLKEENKRRNDIIKSGGEVYGPEKYTESGYYQYLHSIRLQELREAIFKQSGSDNTEERFENTLLDELKKDYEKKITVEKNEAVLSRIDSFS